MIGSLILYSDAPVPELAAARSSWSLPVALAFAAILVFLLTLAAKAFREPVVTGEEALIGQEGEVTGAHRAARGRARFSSSGEYWNAD